MKIRCLLSFLRLGGCLVLEGLTSMFHLALFVLRRRSERRRIYRLIAGLPAGRNDTGVRLSALFILLAAGGFLAGCGSSEVRKDSSRPEESAPKSAFQKQLDQVGDSTMDIIDMSDAPRSIESDLEDLADPEWDQLSQTIELFGW
jgi:hypothetical protein